MSWRSTIFWAYVAILGVAGPAVRAANFTNLLSIDFESVEGYTNGRSLDGQSHWFMSPTETNGSGITSIWPGLGQQAYLGISRLTTGDDSLLGAYPLGFTPTPGSFQYVAFSVVMAISASTHGGADNFAWYFINNDSTELIGVDFFNSNGQVGFEINHGEAYGIVSSKFTNSALYRLEIDMDFTQDTWTATLGDEPVTPGPEPIGEPGDTMNLSAPIVSWQYGNAFSPGNNAIYFDHLRVVAGTSPPPLPAPQLKVSIGGAPRAASISVSTEPGLTYNLQSSTDLQRWNRIASTFATNLTWTISDPITAATSQKFYRAAIAVQ